MLTTGPTICRPSRGTADLAEVPTIDLCIRTTPTINGHLRPVRGTYQGTIGLSGTSQVCQGTINLSG